MKNKLRNVLIGVLCVAVLILLAVAVVRSHNQKCETLKISIAQSDCSKYFTEQQALQLLKNSDVYPVGKKIREIDAAALKKTLSQNPWFNDLKNISIEGTTLTLTLSVTTPIAMVFPLSNQPYILGNNGAMLPDNPQCTNLTIINGNINVPYTRAANVNSLNNKPLIEAYRTALQISKSATSRAQFPQIYVNNIGQIELYSTLGNHLILLGDASNIADKLNNIRSVYANGILPLGANNYSYLDARFPDRIYARKTELKVSSTP